MAIRVLGSTPIPAQSPIADRSGILSRAWWDYLGLLPLTLSATPSRVNSVSLSAQHATIGATDFSSGPLPGGLYRISYYAQITTAASTSSTLTIAFGWKNGTVAQSWTGTAITGNTTGTSQSGGPILLRADAGQAITYAATYGSVGATAMVYALDVVLERVIE